MPKLMTNRFSHGTTHHAPAPAELRATVGSFVKIRNTNNTRQYARDMIGQIFRVCTDVRGHQPYQVENSPVWFYETDVEHNFTDRPKPGLARPSQPLGDGGWPAFSGPNNLSKTTSWGNTRTRPTWDTAESCQWLGRESTADSQMLTREPTAESYMFSREPTAENLAFTRESTFENVPWEPMKDCHFAPTVTFESNVWEPPRDSHMVAWEAPISNFQPGQCQISDEDSDDAWDQMAVQMAIQSVSYVREIDAAAKAVATPSASASAEQPVDLASEIPIPRFSLGAEKYEVCLRGTFLHVAPKSPTSRRAKSAPGSKCLDRNDMEDKNNLGQMSQMYVEKFCGDVERLWDTVAAGESTTSTKQCTTVQDARRSFTFGEFVAELEGETLESASRSSPTQHVRMRSTSWADDEHLSVNSATADQQQQLIEGPIDMDAIVASMPPNHRELLKEFELGSPDLPTMGSAGHYFSHCKPCCFVYTKGCANGVACVFCHLCDAGEKKRRQKERYEKKKRQWRQMQDKRQTTGKYTWS